MGKKNKKNKMVIEIDVVEAPTGLRGGQVTAAAIGVGSFAVEFIRKHPEVLDGFHAWLDEKHPEAPPVSGSLTAGRLALVDAHLSVLAAQVADFDPFLLREPEGSGGSKDKSGVKAAANGSEHLDHSS